MEVQMQQSQQPSDKEPSAKHEVRTYEAPGTKYPENVVEVETSFDELSLSETKKELDRLRATPDFEYAQPAAMVADMMSRLGKAMDGLDTATAVLKMTVGYAMENESGRVKIEFLLNGGIDGYSDQEMIDASRRADELDRKAGVRPESNG
jgi:hypothetical protein